MDNGVNKNNSNGGGDLDNTDSNPEQLLEMAFENLASNSQAFQQLESDLFNYNMTYPQRGKCLIFNNKVFEPHTRLNDRRGTEIDAGKLYRVFEKLKFDVTIFNNNTTTEIKRALKKVSQEDHSNNDCFVCCILSHGDRGVIYGRDGKMDTNDFFVPFLGNVCPSLTSKPKLFFIQACQGDKLDPGVALYRSPGRDMTDAGSGFQSNTVPVHSDFLVAYSTVPGYYSWRNTTQGSWFIQSLASVLETYHQDLDLLSMMTLVNYKVANEFISCVPNDPIMNQKKQSPYIASMLTKRVVFYPKP